MTSLLDDSITGQRNEKRVEVAAATGLLAAASGAGAGAAMAEIVTVTTTQQYDATMTSSETGASFDVLFPTILNATDLLSISDGSVYTGEGAILTIDAIASNDTTVSLFSTDGYMTFFQNKTLAEITDNTFTDFSARDIKGLRFTLSQFPPVPKPSLTLPSGTQFVFEAVPEPVAAVLLGCGLAAVLIGRNCRRFLQASPAK